MLTSEFIPVQGGIGTYVMELSKNLPSCNDIMIVAPNTMTNYNGSTNQALPGNVEIYPIEKSASGLVGGLKFQWACKKNIEKIVNDFRPDIIHTQSTMPDLFINPERIRVPIVTTVHSTVRGQNKVIRASGMGNSDIAPAERMVARLGSLIEPVERRYYKKRKHFITVSNYCEKKFVNNWGKDSNDVRVIPNGVDAISFNPSNTSENSNFLKTPGVDIPKVLFLSRLVGIKGIRTFIDSIEIVNASTKAHFLIAGSGQFEGLNAIKAENVTKLGYVPHELAPSLMLQSDIFVLPSYHENCPLTLLEAMASGKAVVAADVGGVPEIVKNGENGILIANDANELAEAIIRLVGDPSMREKLGLAARKTVEESFTWERSAQMTDDYYRRLITG